MHRRRPRALWRCLGVTVMAGMIGGTAFSGAANAAPAAVPQPLGGTQHCCTPSPPYIQSVRTALNSNTDLWGNYVRSLPGGPTYNNVKNWLVPVAYGGVATGQPNTGSFGVTDTGYPYLPLTMPEGNTSVVQTQPAAGHLHYALHVADGSEIISDWHDPCASEPWTAEYSAAFSSRCPNFRETQFHVGANGSERVGQDLARLTQPSLYKGYLPVLEVGYRDAQATRFQEESFAARVKETSSLVSFVKITADPAPGATQPDTFRVSVTSPGNPVLTVHGNELGSGSATQLAFSGNPSFTGNQLVYTIKPGSRGTVIYLAVLNNPTTLSHSRAVVTPGRYIAARQDVARYWEQQLAQGAQVSVPDPHLMNAMKNLLIQNLVMGWRYSIGNFYEQFYVPEMSNTISELGEYGFLADYRANLQTLLGYMKSGPAYPTAYQDWEEAAKLVAINRYYDLSGDKAFVDQNLSLIVQYLTDFAQQVKSDPHGILQPQRCCEDNSANAYWSHTELQAWDGWQGILRTLRETGHGNVAASFQPGFNSFNSALHAAVRQSEVWLPDGSLFIPEELLAGQRPYQTITATRDGSYWNLLSNYGAASGFFPAGGTDSKAILRYLELHGGTLLGLVRFNYTGQPIGQCDMSSPAGYRGSGIDEVYGYQYDRLLAQNNQPGRQILSLYGQLANDFTRGTFLTGEGVEIDPCPGGYYRGTWLSPDSANNAVLLKDLRNLLVEEQTSPAGRPDELELAFATPRGWLANGKSISVAGLPTSFGKVSYTLHSDVAHQRVNASLVIPASARAAVVKLRLRVPAGLHLTAATINGRAVRRFDGATATIDLTGYTGHVTVRAMFSR